ncbi:hypothetical protein FVR03_20905 [Pontibacter qinzhouensis]|uniref:Uncharacterized protein n=1 Tax=Pontibacter qinzhouensis TaxID=2603253 RepID=A0A5C8J2D4_9BACT|nr:hypothetical protein [Pontibacter qinzhouensis]TXK28403.1 hypothetical protein FVR03_20905 [Pontibacter qinzhouensis]
MALAKWEILLLLQRKNLSGALNEPALFKRSASLAGLVFWFFLYQQHSRQAKFVKEGHPEHAEGSISQRQSVCYAWHSGLMEALSAALAEPKV